MTTNSDMGYSNIAHTDLEGLATIVPSTRFQNPLAVAGFPVADYLRNGVLKLEFILDGCSGSLEREEEDHELNVKEHCRSLLFSTTAADRNREKTCTDSKSFFRCNRNGK
jgi:hypothetical protein